MLTLADCIALCDLSDDEIEAIAEYEHLPQALAAALGLYLVHTGQGRAAISGTIRHDIAAAHAKGDLRRTATLKFALTHFIREYGMSSGRSALGEGRRLC